MQPNRLAKESRVRVLGREKGWLKIDHAGTTGYILEKKRFIRLTHIDESAASSVDAAQGMAPAELKELQAEAESLKEKLFEIHREADHKGLSCEIEYDEKYNSWAVSLSKDDHIRYALLHKDDVDGCMAGEKCIYFWSIINEYASILEEKSSLTQ